MGRSRWVEILVGLFLLLGIISLLVLALKVSGLNGDLGAATYRVKASFDNIGGLKIRSRVTMAGVRIGEISAIELDPKTFRANVTMNILATNNMIPVDSSAAIFTEGLLGANYISLTPGFDDALLKDGSTITETHSALVLENLIGQFLYSQKENKQKTDK